MTVDGLKKALANKENLVMIKTTGNLEVHASRVDGELTIDEANQLLIYKDVNGLTIYIDATDICAITINDSGKPIEPWPW